MNKVALALTLSAIVSTSVRSQSKDDQLTEIRNSLRQEVSRQMPGWKCRSITPIQGSSGVIIDHCESADIAVKIAVTRARSVEEAQAAQKETMAHLRLEEEVAAKRGKELHLIKEELSLGDGGFVWDIIGSEAVEFRKGRFIVNVSVPLPEGNKDAFFARKFSEYAARVLEGY